MTPPALARLLSLVLARNIEEAGLPGRFGLLDRRQDDRVPLDRMVEAHGAVSIHDLSREGLLVADTTARIEAGEAHGGYQLAVRPAGILELDYQLAVRPAGILELDGQPVRLVPHCALPMHCFVCPGCGAERYRLSRVKGIWRCRECHRLDYASRHCHRSIPGFNRAIYLRRRLRVDDRPFAPIPPQPLRRRKWWRLLIELRDIEGQLVRHLRQDVRIVLERRDGRRRPHVDPS